MSILNVNNVKKLLVIGPINDRVDVLENVKPIINQYDLIVFNGNITCPLDNFKINLRMELMSDILKTGKAIYNISGVDYKLSKEHPFIDAWLKGKPNVVNVKFARGTSALIVSGGITPEMKKYEDLYDNLELSFVNLINNKPWHQSYNGRFGYVISNNPSSGTEPKFFNFSAQIGIECYENKVYAQEVGEHGLGKTFLL